MERKILCIDFDGVIHSYKSGWQGADVVSDPPVHGAIPWLVDLVNKGWGVAIYSARSSQSGGIRAMQQWLLSQGMSAAMVLEEIQFPREKPPAYLTIDDRAWCFQGTFPTQGELENFVPWHQRHFGMMP